MYDLWSILNQLLRAEDISTTGLLITILITEYIWIEERLVKLCYRFELICLLKAVFKTNLLYFHKYMGITVLQS